MSAHAIENSDPLYGLMAEFETPGDLVSAARRDAGSRIPEVRRVLAVSHP